jgi:hypothetical protein
MDGVSSATKRASFILIYPELKGKEAVGIHRSINDEGKAPLTTNWSI